jgi:hypothetical protein
MCGLLQYLGITTNMHYKKYLRQLRLRPDWHWCPALVLAPSLNMMLPNEIGHSAQERTLPLEVDVNNGTVLNMFCELF